MQKLFPRIKVFGTFNAQYVRKGSFRKGKLNGCAVMKLHAIFDLRFEGTSPAMFDVSPRHVEPDDGERRKILR